MMTQLSPYGLVGLIEVGEMRACRLENACTLTCYEGTHDDIRTCNTYSNRLYSICKWTKTGQQDKILFIYDAGKYLKNVSTQVYIYCFGSKKFEYIAIMETTL